jgi:hypothetical protein
MRLLATLMLVLAFALVRPLAGQAEGLGPCVEAPAAQAAMDMPCHEMAGMDHETPAKPEPSKIHAACASACCATPAVVPAAMGEPVLIRQAMMVSAAIEPAASPVPHAPDLRPPIA